MRFSVVLATALFAVGVDSHDHHDHHDHHHMNEEVMEHHHEHEEEHDHDHESPEARMKEARVDFDKLDTDNNGFLSVSELVHYLTASTEAEEGGFKLSPEEAEKEVEGFIQEADSDNDKSVSFQEYFDFTEKLLQQHMEQMAAQMMGGEDMFGDFDFGDEDFDLADDLGSGDDEEL